MKSILIVEDDPAIVRYMRAVLEPLGHTVRAVNSVIAAYGRFHAGCGMDLLIADSHLLGDAGLIALALWLEHPAVPVILLSTGAPQTPSDTDRTFVSLLPEDSVVYLEKPFAPNLLRRTVSQMIG